MGVGAKARMLFWFLILSNIGKSTVLVAVVTSGEIGNGNCAV
jgi:hypothetical protein